MKALFYNYFTTAHNNHCLNMLSLDFSPLSNCLETTSFSVSLLVVSCLPHCLGRSQYHSLLHAASEQEKNARDSLILVIMNLSA